MRLCQHPPEGCPSRLYDIGIFNGLEDDGHYLITRSLRLRLSRQMNDRVFAGLLRHLKIVALRADPKTFSNANQGNGTCRNIDATSADVSLNNSPFTAFVIWSRR